MYSFFDLYFDPEGKVFEKDPETSDNVHIVTDSGEIKSLKIRSNGNTKDFQPVKYEKDLLLKVFHALMKRENLKEEVIQPVKQHISGKDENFYILSSFAIFLSLCNMLSAEFNSPMFSEELFVKVNLDSTDNKWSKLFTRFWNIWSQIILGNQLAFEKQVIESNEVSEPMKTYEEGKESESIFEKELQEVLSEGGIDIPLVIEMVKNISYKQRTLHGSGVKNITPEPRIVEIKDSEEKIQEDANTKANDKEQKYQALIENLKNFKETEKTKFVEKAEKGKTFNYKGSQTQTEKKQVEKEQVKREQTERQQIERQQTEREQVENQQVGRGQTERDQTERDQTEREQTERQQTERQQTEREQLRQQTERDQSGKERTGQTEKQQTEKEQSEKEQSERERIERDLEKIQTEPDINTYDDSIVFEKHYSFHKQPVSDPENERFKEEVLRKISRLERQVLSITVIVKKILERIS
jgi:hypothetical protein